MRYDTLRFLDAGEAALSVEFGDSVDPALNASVLALDAALRVAALTGVCETVPTYRSLMVHYEPLEISRDDLLAHIAEMLRSIVETRPDSPPPCGEGLGVGVALSFRASATPQPRPSPQGGREQIAQAAPRWVAPCCYDPALAEDIAELAALIGVTAQQAAALHAGADYRAYMYGFAPGWLYLGGLPPALAVPRRTRLRGATPPGAVLVGGGLSLIATNPMPTGWYVVGRTPERLFSLTREPPFLIEPGDAIRFEPVDAATFVALEAQAARGEPVARREAP
jgi:inhibitor of KinA